MRQPEQTLSPSTNSSLGNYTTNISTLVLVKISAIFNFTGIHIVIVSMQDENAEIVTSSAEVLSHWPVSDSFESVGDLRGAKIYSFSCSFREKLGK